MLPAAGRGTRLSSKGPKLLYQFGDLRPIDIFHRCLSPLVGETVVIVSPEWKAKIDEELFKLNWPATTVKQNVPHGMGHAVMCAKELALNYENTLIVWGDQISVNSITVRKSIALHHYHRKQIKITLPVAKIPDPYIAIEWGDDGNLLNVFEKRNGHQMPEWGYNDCGVFVAESDALFSLLLTQWNSRNRDIDDGIESEESEFNLLPLLPLVGNEVLGFEIYDKQQTIGLNTKSDSEVFLDMIRLNKEEKSSDE